MGRYDKKQVPETRLADHKRFCRECGMITNLWFHCGQRTGRVNMTPTLKDKAVFK